jgi:hypothetical protein
VNASGGKTRAWGKSFAKKLGLSEKDYRRQLALLRARLDVVEVKMSANQWDAVKYEAVPPEANVLYRKAFVKHDEERRNEFLAKLQKGEAAINSFDLLLDAAGSNAMKQEELPAAVLVVSDTEFDACAFSNSKESINEKLFTAIKKRRNEKGCALPRLVFWNVCSRTNTVPVKENGPGAALANGFPPNVSRMIMSGKLDPFEALCDVLAGGRYSKVTYS